MNVQRLHDTLWEYIIDNFVKSFGNTISEGCICLKRAHDRNSFLEQEFYVSGEKPSTFILKHY